MGNDYMNPLKWNKETVKDVLPGAAMIAAAMVAMDLILWVLS